MPYQVYDRVTGALMGTYKTLKRAHTKKDQAKRKVNSVNA